MVLTEGGIADFQEVTLSHPLQDIHAKARSDTINLRGLGVFPTSGHQGREQARGKKAGHPAGPLRVTLAASYHTAARVPLP